jgi:hypothetical protein
VSDEKTRSRMPHSSSSKALFPALVPPPSVPHQQAPINKTERLGPRSSEGAETSPLGPQYAAYLQAIDDEMHDMSPAERDRCIGQLQHMIETRLAYSQRLSQRGARLVEKMGWLNHPPEAVEQSA